MDIAYNDEAWLMRWQRVGKAGGIIFLLCLVYLIASQSTNRTTALDYIAYHGAKLSPYLFGVGAALILIVWGMSKRR